MLPRLIDAVGVGLLKVIDGSPVKKALFVQIDVSRLLDQKNAG